MISIDRDRGFIFLHRADYLYRDGLENRDENAAREMGDGDICIPIPEYMKDRRFDRDAGSDGQDAVTIIEEIIRRISSPENGGSPR